MNEKTKIPCRVEPAEDGKLNAFADRVAVRQNDNSRDLYVHQGDIIQSEIDEKFVPKKIRSAWISEAYQELGWQRKSERVTECSTFLEFLRTVDNDGVLSERSWLTHANFCKDRFCPMCAWRRSLKIFSQMCQVMDQLGNNYTYLLLTLTVPSVSGADLGAEITHLMESWHRFTQYKELKNVIYGYFRALEITRNKKTKLYHPHFHVILAVPKTYLKHEYIARDKWLQYWQKATKDDSITQVDVRVARDKRSSTDCHESGADAMKSVILEIAKYVTKDTDVVDASVLRDLVNALYHRRLYQYGGVFKDAFNKLGLEDAEGENTDLVGNDGLRPDSDLLWLFYQYSWSQNSKNYALDSQRYETPAERAERASTAR